MKGYGLTITFLLLSTYVLSQAQPPVTIGHIAIVDTPGISEHELNQIAHEVEGKTCTTNYAEGFIADQVLEAFQARGYFRATVVEPKLKPSKNGKADANVVVVPGVQYRLARSFEGRSSAADLCPCRSHLQRTRCATDKEELAAVLRRARLSQGRCGASINRE
jgi:hypothetical protein